MFIDFDGVMTNARLVLNGKQLAAHHGGYPPWSVELTSSLVRGDNVLAVVVDSRWLAVPPGGAPLQASTVDFLQPGGNYRYVRLRVVPEAFISEVFAKPLDVLTPHRRVEVACTVDSGRVPPPCRSPSTCLTAPAHSRQVRPRYRSPPAVMRPPKCASPDSGT